MPCATTRRNPAGQQPTPGTAVKPRLENLEPRLLMTIANDSERDDQLSLGLACSCPVCSGMALSNLGSQVASASASGALSSLSSIPALNSLPGASASLFLDFDGNRESQWGSYSNVTTPVFDRDGDRTTFSNDELLTIQEIWSRVAEDYAPFKINVTTVDPGNSTDRVTARIAIGGNWSDWFGQPAGGVAYIGGFSNYAPNVGYVFEDALANGHASYVAEAASHEAGHLFGLQHQAKWSGTRLVEAYNTGTSQWAPIMGVGYYSQRTTWNRGPTDRSSTTIQDDMALISGSQNGFGYRADDVGNSLTSATRLTPVDSTLSATGLIGTTTDTDWFSFSTGAGNITLEVQGNRWGSNLDSVLELRNAQGQLILTANPTDSLNARLSATVTAGTYVAVVKSSGGYGNVGTYTLTGSVIATTGSAGGSGGSVQVAAAGELDAFVGRSEIQSNDTLSFGSNVRGRSVDQTVTLKNTGTATLQLTRLDANTMPSGFTLVSNLGTTSLAPGRSTTFRVRMTGQQVGTYSGTLQIGSNDADESPFVINLSGTVTPPITAIDNGAAGFTSSGAWSLLRSGRDRDAQTSSTTGSTATWTFQNLLPGTYRVLATYSPHATYSQAAPFTVLDGSTAVQTVLINQSLAPNDLNWSSSKWESLGNFTISGDTLAVQLSSDGSSKVIADAIRIEWVGASESPRVLGRSSLITHVNPGISSSYLFAARLEAIDLQAGNKPLGSDDRQAPGEFNEEDTPLSHELMDLRNATSFAPRSLFREIDRPADATDATLSPDDVAARLDQTFAQLEDWLNACNG